jgi:hypothetical protein
MNKLHDKPEIRSSMSISKATETSTLVYGESIKFNPYIIILYYSKFQPWLRNGTAQWVEVNERTKF